MSSPPGDETRRAVLVRGGLIAVALALAAVGAVVVATVPPTQASFYPKCTLYQTTGLHCPGCGTTRALHALLNGRLAQAVAYNPLALVLLPYLGVLAARSVWRSYSEPPTRRRRFADRWNAAVPWVIVAVTTAFWVLRNVPVYPLTLLAPHELSP